MTHSIKKLKSVPSTAAVSASNGAQGYRVGRITGLSEAGWLVDCGVGQEPVVARTTLAMDAAAMSGAAAAQRSALLVFENEELDKPIVIGLLAPPPGEAPVAKLDAVVDGERVVIEAANEIVLRCGEASITLRRNGRVVVRGTYVETRSRGINRIKGGSVQIN